MAVAMIGPKFYAWDRNGKPLAFGKLYTYEARTNSPKDTYKTEDQITANTNPVILNGEGYADVYLDGSYKMVLKDKDDNEIWSSDPVTAAQASEWINCFAATYLSPTSFKITGNVTDKYVADRRVRMNDGSNFAYATIESSSYGGGETTVVVKTSNVSVNIESVCVSIVSPESLPPSLSPTIEADTVQDMIDLAESLNNGDAVKTKGYYAIADGGGIEYFISTSSDLFGIDLGNGLFANPNNITTPRQVGWTESGGQANYEIIEKYAENGYAVNSYDTISTLYDITARWLAGEKYPMAFYGDSTTDGATTTDHVASFVDGSVGNFSSPIVMNDSPNAYPRELEGNLNLMIGSANLAIYNTGFDSMSLKNNFGNKCFHRVFFGFNDGLNNQDFSDVKAIALSWGTSDSINLNDIPSIRESYEWKMELLIIECFERGIQPYINDPVLNFQRTGTGVSGRQNDQSISIIESINQRLREKYNLEQLSLRLALENYVEKAFEQDKDFTEVLATDGVHPNDKGHAHIASWMTAWLHPLVKWIKGGETYKFTAGNPYPITLGTDQGSVIWPSIDNDFVVTRTSFYYRWNPVVNNQFMYRIFVFCEEPMDLTYDMLSFGNDQKADNRISKLEVINYSDISSKKARFFADNQGITDIGQGTPWFSGSHQLLARLKVGLNQINVTAPEDAVYSNQSLGFLRIEPRNERDTIKETVSSGFVLFDQNVQHKDIRKISSGASSSIQWSENHFSRENYHFSKILETTLLTFKANTLHNRNIYWNGNRAFKDFDCYNVLKFSGTDVELYRADATNSNGEVTTETLIASATSGTDLSTIVTDNIYYISVVHNAIGNTDVFVQMTNISTGITNNIAVMTNIPNEIYAGGYGFGAFKAQSDSLPMIITDISVDFSA